MITVNDRNHSGKDCLANSDLPGYKLLFKSKETIENSELTHNVCMHDQVELYYV